MKKIVFATLIVSAMSPLPSAWADQRFAAFPVDVKMTVAAKVGETIYAGLGTAGSGWYALDMSRHPAQWEALAPFPDQPRENANAVAIGPVIYVFNGQGKARPENKNLIVFDTVWKYDTVANAWSKVSTRSPLGGLAAGATTLDRQNILFFGGANKAIFDGYWTDHVDAAAAGKTMQSEVDERYFKQRPQDYLFTAQVLSYNPSRNQWRNLGIDPYPATTGAAIAR